MSPVRTVRCNESIADGDADVNGHGYEKSWINSNPMLMDLRSRARRFGQTSQEELSGFVNDNLKTPVRFKA